MIAIAGPRGALPPSLQGLHCMGTKALLLRPAHCLNGTALAAWQIVLPMYLTRVPAQTRRTTCEQLHVYVGFRSLFYVFFLRFFVCAHRHANNLLAQIGACDGACRCCAAMCVPCGVLPCLMRARNCYAKCTAEKESAMLASRCAQLCSAAHGCGRAARQARRPCRQRCVPFCLEG